MAKQVTITAGIGLTAGLAALLGGAQSAKFGCWKERKHSTLKKRSHQHTLQGSGADPHACVASVSAHSCASELVSMAGAVAVGAAHFAGSTKALAEEGIDPRVRLRALPMAVSADQRSFAFFTRQDCSGFTLETVRAACLALPCTAAILHAMRRHKLLCVGTDGRVPVTHDRGTMDKFGPMGGTYCFWYQQALSCCSRKLTVRAMGAMQFRALAISTGACAAVGVAAFAGMRAGLPVRSEARVSSWSQAVDLARQERVSSSSQILATPRTGSRSRSRAQRHSETPTDETRVAAEWLLCNRRWCRGSSGRA